jgi:hypothetical protein
MLTAGAGDYPFSVGHAFEPGQLPAEIIEGIQCDVKSRWPDRSIKIAILSGSFTATGTSTDISIGAGIPPLGANLTTAQLKATGISASFTTSAYGSASWGVNSADWDSPFAVWTAGPYCSTWIYRKQIGSDPHLTAWMEVRFFSTGDVSVLPWIENGYLMVTGPTAKPGDYSFALGGTNRYGPTALPVWHHTRSPLINGALLEYWFSADKTVTPKHDTAYLEGTGLVTPMLSTVDRNLPAFPAFGGVSASFEPYQSFDSTNSMHSTNMGSAGGADSIGIQPGWESIALVDSSKLGYEQMLRESFRFGQLQIHYRDEDTNKPVAFSTRANIQLRIGETESATYSIVNVANREDYSGQTSTPAIVGDNGGDPGGGGSVTNVRKWARSHQPGSPVLAYITSGRYWFMEECQHIAGVNFLSTPWTREGTEFHVCRPVRSPARMQMREAAWCFRNLVNAATVTPDDDPLKAEYDASVDHNITYYHDLYAPGDDMPEGLNPYGLIEHEGNGTTGGDQAWQYDFFTMAWAKAIMMRAGSSRAQRIKARAFFDWVSRSIVGRAGGTGSTEHLYRWISTSFAVGGIEYSSLFPGSNESVYPDWTRNASNGPWWSSWGAYYDANAITQGFTGGRTDGAIAGGYSSDATAWTMFAITALRACASLEAPGATTAMARLEASADWSWWTTRTSGIWGGDTRPTNAHATRTLHRENFTEVIPAAGVRANVNLNDAYEVDFERSSGWHPGNLQERWWGGFGAVSDGTVFQDAVQAYSGTTWAPEYGAAGAMLLNGGSDGAQLAQIVYGFDFDSLTWWSAGAPSNLPPNFDWANYYWTGTNYLQKPDGLPRPIASTEARDDVFYDYLWNGSYIKLANHSYLHNAYVPESQGGGKNGSLLLPCSSYSHDRGDADPRNGKVDTFTLHLMNLHSGRGVRAVTAPVAHAGETDGFKGFTQTISVRDTTRGRLWFLRNGVPQAQYLDLTGGAAPYAVTAHTVQKVSGGNADYTVTANSTWVYVPEADAMVAIYPTNANSIPAAAPSGLVGVQVYSINGSGNLIDQERADFQTRLPIATYSFPKGGVLVGVAWVPASVVGGFGKFYIYEGFGDTYCYTLTPSSLDFTSCTFTWGREDFSGATPVFKNAYLNTDWQRLGVQGKWQFVSALGCLAWQDGPNTSGVCVDGTTRQGIVQLWRPPGAPI